MATASLNATVRTERGTGVARKLRQAGSVPAVIYGHGREPQSLALNTRDVEKLLSQHLGRQHGHRAHRRRASRPSTLIREIQRHPFKRNILHVDFQELVAGEKITVSIPLRFTGTAEGVRNSRRYSRGDDAPGAPPRRSVEHPGSHRRRRDAADDRPQLSTSATSSCPRASRSSTTPDATVCVCTAPKAAVEATPALKAKPRAGAPSRSSFARRRLRARTRPRAK